MAEAQAFAEKAGLKVVSVDERSHTVKLEGTPSQLGSAFGVKLGRFREEGGPEFRAYEGRLKLPAGADAVLGLDNRPIAKSRMVVSGDVGAQGFIGPRIADLYKFPKGLDGTGQTIGIIELGGGYKDEDLKAYFHRANVKAPEVKSVSVDGATNAPEGKPNSADGEVALDIEVAGSVAPGAKQVVYFAPNSEQGFVDAINQAIHDQENHPNVISISWGAPEKEWTPEGLAAMNNAFKDAAALGINVYCASGDRGAKDGESDGKMHADFPAASPYAIGCGGTRLKTDSGQITSETVWRDLWGLGGSTGGGVSDAFKPTDWQVAHAHLPKPTNLNGGRGVPDVAGNASPASGYLVIVDGQEMTTGGTSAVSPLYAGLNAVLAQGVGGKLGYLAPTFYAHQEAFNDITKGNNGGYSAGPGWDPTTGVGSPNGEKLLAALKADQAAVAVPSAAPPAEVEG
ncbi:MAG: peptidase S53 [Proteobacteria bacterium]|nr:peptidase S53 [Pseudomonadota bacterium]